MKWFLKILRTEKNAWRILFIMFPAIILGWIFFPYETVTYINWVMLYMMIQLRDDVMDIKNKLDKK
jgi:hypothetical protein